MNRLKTIITLALVLLVCVSVSSAALADESDTAVAEVAEYVEPAAEEGLALSNEKVYTIDDYCAMLDRLNEKYGTEFRLLSIEEMKDMKSNAHYTEEDYERIEKLRAERVYTEDELKAIEEKFVHIAEVEVPQWLETSRQAEIEWSRVYINS